MREPGSSSAVESPRSRSAGAGLGWGDASGHGASPVGSAAKRAHSPWLRILRATATALSASPGAASSAKRFVEANRRGNRSARDPKCPPPVRRRRRQWKRARNPHELHAIGQGEGRRLERAAREQVPVLRRDTDPHGGPAARLRQLWPAPARVGGVTDVFQAQSPAGLRTPRIETAAAGRPPPPPSPSPAAPAPRSSGACRQRDPGRASAPPPSGARPAPEKRGRHRDPVLGPLPPRLRRAETFEQYRRAAMRDPPPAGEEAQQESRERLGRRVRVWVRVIRGDRAGRPRPNQRCASPSRSSAPARSRSSAPSAKPCAAKNAAAAAP